MTQLQKDWYNCNSMESNLSDPYAWFMELTNIRNMTKEIAPAIRKNDTACQFTCPLLTSYPPDAVHRRSRQDYKELHEGALVQGFITSQFAACEKLELVEEVDNDL